MDCHDNILKFDAHQPSVSLLKDLLKTQGVHNIQFDLIQTETNSLYRNIILFKYQVTDGRFIAIGQGYSKRKAKEIAAQNFLRILNKEFPELCPDSLFQSHMNDALVKNNMFEPMTVEASHDQYSPIDDLHRLCSSLKYDLPVYITEGIIGPQHNCIYKISCTVLQYKQTGEAKTKKIAKRIAANKILSILKQKQIDINTDTKNPTNVDDIFLEEFASLYNHPRSPDYLKQLPVIHKTLPLTEGPWFNYIRGMKNEELQSCDSKNVLDSFIAEQGLKLTFIDFKEISHSGTYQTSLHVDTPITLAFCGESSSYEEAHKLAAINALEFFKTILSNRAYKPLNVKS